jgi:hypothetical protein
MTRLVSCLAIALSRRVRPKFQNIPFFAPSYSWSWRSKSLSNPSTHTSAVTFLPSSGSRSRFRMSKLPRFSRITHSQKYAINAVPRKFESALLGPYVTALTTYCNIMRAAANNRDTR